MTGIGRYLLNLIENLSKIDDRNKYILFSDAPFAHKPETGVNFEYIVIPKGISQLYWEQVKLPLELRRRKIDILHCPKNYGVPFFAKARVILTVHDVIPMIFREYWYLKKGRRVYELLLKLAFKKADKIIVDSKNTKKDIVEYLRISDDKINIVPLAVSKYVVRENKTGNYKSWFKQYDIKDNYILHIGGFGFNKNTVRVIQAYKELKKQGLDYQLVIVGNKDWFGPDILKEINRFEKDDIVLTGYITDDELACLYSRTSLFVYPSLYEGFGLPVLEAFVCGAPVVTSNTSSLPEIADNSAVLVDPKDVAEIVRGIKQVLTDPTLRASLIRRGLKRVKDFSWDNTAKKTLEVYNSLLDLK